MYLILISLLILIDQVTKINIKSFLNSEGSYEVINKIFYLTYVENRGAAFGMFQNSKAIFIIAALGVTLVGIYYLYRVDLNKITKISICMIIAGAIGNMIDRVRLGYVIDFFDFRFIWSYVFNFADILVVVGTIVLCIELLFGGSDKK
ncbi:signal peptidase II [Peptostreptococcus faecalis]|uniref:signal peptidase II n=1 Tax=Peptostreptococcus faecalis TaxID=2045015 RepID=UPI000C7A7781|nr:signal peptidase II [Peptostreptococcus faecalis]